MDLSDDTIELKMLERVDQFEYQSEAAGLSRDDRLWFKGKAAEWRVVLARFKELRRSQTIA